jgi:hypothetical protein
MRKIREFLFSFRDDKIPKIYSELSSVKTLKNPLKTKVKKPSTEALLICYVLGNLILLGYNLPIGASNFE